jgi:hypothetical protein
MYNSVSIVVEVLYKWERKVLPDVTCYIITNESAITLIVYFSMTDCLPYLE